jgi:hypothetical protein
MHQADGSGASAAFMVESSSASSSMRSLARMREKWRQRRFMRNFLPSGDTARLK